MPIDSAYRAIWFQFSKLSALFSLMRMIYHQMSLDIFKRRENIFMRITAINVITAECTNHTKAGFWLKVIRATILRRTWAQDWISLPKYLALITSFLHLFSALWNWTHFKLNLNSAENSRNATIFQQSFVHPCQLFLLYHCHICKQKVYFALQSFRCSSF